MSTFCSLRIAKMCIRDRVYEVNIPENIPEFQSPEAEEAYAMIPEKHPRIFGKVTTGRPLTTDQKKLRAAYRRAADIALDKAVADYKVKGEPIPCLLYTSCWQ